MAQPPPLPASAPADLQDFVACRAASVTFKNGPVDFIDLKALGLPVDLPKALKPSLTITPGNSPAKATITLSAGPMTFEVPAFIGGGKLTLDTSKIVNDLPDSVIDGLTGWADGLNAWLAANRKQLAPPTFGSGSMTLTKVPVAAAQPGPSSGVVSPIPVMEPAPSPTMGPTPSTPATTTADEPYYQPTYVEQPTISNREAFPLGAKAKPPTAKVASGKTASGSAGPVKGSTAFVGAGGPGGPKAPAGLGTMARNAIIGAAILAILATGGFVALGGLNGPGGGGAGGAGGAGPSRPPSPATVGASPARVATTPPVTNPPSGPSAPSTSQPATTVPSAAVGPVFGRFEVTKDVAIDHCHHSYEIEFWLTDANGNRDGYAGGTVVYQVLTGQHKSMTVPAGGTWTVTLTEAWTKTKAGCYSQLNPQVFTFNGQPTY